MAGAGRRGRVLTSRRLGVLAMVSCAAVIAAGLPPVVAHASSGPVVAADTTTPVTALGDASAAMAAAQAQGVRVQVMSATTARSTTWANPDGTFTSDVSPGAVNVQGADGSWSPVDTTLVAVSGGYAPANVAVPLTFGGAGSTALVSGSPVKGGQPFKLSWGGGLPAPTVSGSSITYPGIGGGSLVLTATASGFEVSLVLAKAPGKNFSLRVPMSYAGLSLSTTADGGLSWANSAGKQVAFAPAPAMWDAAIDPASGDPAHMGTVTMSMDTSGKHPALVLTPDPAFLSAASTQYPVTIDPNYDWSANNPVDTWVQTPDYTTSQYTSTELKAGTYDGGADVARSFVKFNVGGLAGKHINSATLTLRDFYSSSCTGASVVVDRIKQDWSQTGLTWGNQPSVSTTHEASNSTALGYSSSCPGGDLSWNVAGIVDDWANQGQPDYGFRIAANNESNSNSWRRFRSNNYGSNPPTLSVNYDSYPNTPKSVSWTPSSSYTSGGTTTYYSTSTTPSVSSVVSDPDGGQVRESVHVYRGGTELGSSPFVSGWVGSGQTASVKIPSGTLSSGVAYTMRVDTTDGTLGGPLSASKAFTVNTTAPAAPSITSTAFTQDAWTNGTVSGPFTFTTASGDGVKFQYSWDGIAWTTLNVGSNSVTKTLTPPAGWDTLQVKAIDTAGNVSTSASYSFGANVALDSPTDQQSSVGTVGLAGTGPADATGVTFQYRLPGASTWIPIPTSDVTVVATGQHLASWPAGLAVSGTTTQLAQALNWDMAATLGHVDQAVEVSAVFARPGGPWTTSTSTVTLDQKGVGGWNAMAPAGPGQVSLITGALTVSVPGAVSGTFISNNTAVSGVFGPGWTATVPSSNWASLVDTGASVVLTDADGGITTFTPDSGGGYTAQGAAQDLTLTTKGSGANMTFVVTSSDGSTTTFTDPGAYTSSPSATTPNNYYPASDTSGSSANSGGALPRTSTTTYYSTGANQGLPHTTFDNTASGVDCSTTGGWVAGCRSTVYSYATVAGSQRLVAVTQNWADTANHTTSTDVACYAYDSSGRLAQAWDPRTAGSTCGSPVLATSFGYDSAGRVTSLTPPGQAAWNFTYDSAGRLATVARTHDATFGGTTATTTFEYHVPIGASSSGDNPDLTATARAGWGQDAAPAYATAVFPPGTTASASDLRDATVYVYDLDGRLIDTAGYSGVGQAGWHIATTQYDQYGNVTSQLSAANRDLALTTSDPTSLGLAPTASSADIAQALSTTNVYSSDGIDLLDTFGPYHQVQLADGTTAYARAHTHNTYCTQDTPPDCADMSSANPTLPTDPTHGGPLHAITQTDESASLSPDPVATDETDTHTTAYAYALSATQTAGWYLGTPMQTTVVVPGGTNIVSQTVMDATTGQTLETRQPSAAGTSTSPGTTQFVYYTAGTNTSDSACGDHAAWQGLLCTQGPGGQPTVSGLPGLPVKRYTDYNMFGAATTTTDTVTDANGNQHVRSTTVTYDGPGGLADRVKSVAVTGGVGAAVPMVSYGYDPSSGLPTTTISDSSAGAGMAGTLTQGYDDFGNPVTFTDAGDATTTTSYDSAGRPVTITYQQADGTTIGTTTLAYNNGSEHRGLPTSLTNTGLGGSFTGSYDGNGQLTSQTWPDGLTSTYTYDPTGSATSLTDTKDGNVFLSDQQVSTIHGQWASESGMLLPFARDYTYDGAGRLTTVADTSTDPLNPGCVTRTYAFDVDSNRTSKATYPAAADGSCSTTTSPTTISSSYDNADRLQPGGDHAGLAYDAYGRITTLPAADGNGTTTSIGYYVNDMVNSTSQGSSSRTWTLDPAMRLRAMTAEAGNPTATVNHYADSTSDSPVWTTDTTSTGTTTTWNIPDLTGGLAATLTGTTATWQLAGLHGDIERTTSPTATLAPDGTVLNVDEYGAPTTTNSPPRYGYLGTHQRATDRMSGLTYMGARLYAASVGLLTEVDPVTGGGPNSYGYPTDPVDLMDGGGTSAVPVDAPRRTAILALAFRGPMYLPIRVGCTACARPFGFSKACVVHLLCNLGTILMIVRAGTPQMVSSNRIKFRALLELTDRRTGDVVETVWADALFQIGPDRWRVPGGASVGLITAYCEPKPGLCPPWVNAW